MAGLNLVLRTLGLILLAVVGLAVVACGGEETVIERTVVVEKIVEKPVIQTVVATVERIVTATPVPVAPRKVQIALGAIVVNLLCGAMPSQQDRIVSTLLCDSFASRDSTGDGLLTPLLGSWTFDGETVRVSIKKNIEFHNGEMLDAPGTKSVIDYLSSGKTAKFAFNYTRFRPYDSIKVVDGNTLDFHLKEPFAFPLTPFRDLFALAPKHLETVALDGYSDNPVGTGPYQFVQWKRDDSLTLKKFQKYWGPKPIIEEITYRQIPEAAVRIAALEAGQIDIAVSIPPQNVPRLLSKNFRIFNVEAFQTETVWLDAGRKSVELKDKRVRQAMLYAIDTVGILESVLGGFGRAADSQLGTPSAFGYNPNVKSYPYDPAKAKALLKEAGYPNGFKVKGVATNGQHFRDREVMTTLAAQWREIGIEVEIEPMETAAWITRLINNQMPPIYNIGMNWSPEDGVTNSRVTAEGGDPKFAAMVAEIRKTTDATQREKLMTDAIAYQHEEAHAWWGHQLPNVYALRNDLPNITFGRGFEMFIPTAPR